MIKWRNEKALTVQPILSYRVPHYPREGEALSLCLEEVQTWPFQRKIAAMVLAFALQGGCSWDRIGNYGIVDTETSSFADSTEENIHLSPVPSIKSTDVTDEVSTVAPAKPAAIVVRDVTENPFASEPKLADWGGKGGPATLPEELAIETIRQTFAKRKIDLRKNVSFDEQNIDAILDGYSPQKKVGFEIISRGRDAGKIQEEILDAKEIQLLRTETKQNMPSIAVIDLYDERFAGGTNYGNAQERQEKLAETIHEFIDYLLSNGML